MNKRIVLTGVIMLVVGIGIGYIIRPSKDLTVDQSATHEMSDSEMQNTMTGMRESLEGKKGEALDIAFLEQMIVHHQGAIDMANIIVANSKQSELKEFSQNIISAQSSEITTMKKWLNQWYGR